MTQSSAAAQAGAGTTAIVATSPDLAGLQEAMMESVDGEPATLTTSMTPMDTR